MKTTNNSPAKTLLLGLATLALSLACIAQPALADDDEYEGGGGWGRDRTVSHQPTVEECGGCHMAYQAWLLPAESWKSVMANLTDHFGDDASLSPAVRNDIESYLVANAGRSYGWGNPPMRISEMGWFRGEHRFSQATLDRRSKGSIANCEGCHRGAKRGWYDDD